MAKRVYRQSHSPQGSMDSIPLLTVLRHMLKVTHHATACIGLKVTMSMIVIKN